jgi:hypothetical protein
LSSAGFTVFFPGERGGFWRLRSPNLISYSVEDATTSGQVWLVFDDPRGRRLSIVSSRAGKGAPAPPPGEKPWNVDAGGVVYISAESGDEVHARIERGDSQALLRAERGITVDELIVLATTLLPAS